MDELEKDKLIKEIFEIIEAKILLVPILDNYELIKEKNDAIFIAKAKDNSIEQYICDGILKEKETFDQRLDKIIKETVKEMQKNNFTNPQLDFITDFNTNLFKFKLYLQDNIKDNKIVRQVNAYFLEPNNNYFYEICLSAPAMSLNIANEEVMKNLVNRITTILQNIKYNENIFEKNN